MNGSLARAAIRELADKGLIRAVAHHSSQAIYTRATNVEEEAKADKAKAKGEAKGGKGGKGAKAEKGEKPEKADKADAAAEA